MKRVQRKRTKGWKMPPNTVYVGRPSKWGNPYKIGEQMRLGYGIGVMTREIALTMYETLLRNKLREDPHFLDPLKGKDLACWCPLDKLCHADVILKILKGDAKA